MMLIERLYTKNKNAVWNYVVEQFRVASQAESRSTLAKTCGADKR